MSTLAAPARCPVCDVPPRDSYTLSNGERLLRCPCCRLGWWNWPPFAPGEFYDRDYFQSAEATKGYNDYASLEAGVRRTARARLRNIQSLLGVDKPNLWEVGCGTGLFLDEARAAGWRAAGNEVSPYAAEQAAQRGLEVRCAAAEELRLPDGALDCVALWDVVEHVRDPAGVLRSAARALRPGGVLALSTGDIESWCAKLSGPRWHLFNLPEHLFFFSARSLELLLGAAGCRVQRMSYEVNWVPLSYIFERLRKTVRGGASRPSAKAGGSGWVLPATLFDVLGVYAVRTEAAIPDSTHAAG